MILPIATIFASSVGVAFFANFLVRRMKYNPQEITDKIEKVKQMGAKRRQIILEEALKASREQLYLLDKNRNEALEILLQQQATAEVEQNQKEDKLNGLAEQLEVLESEVTLASANTQAISAKINTVLDENTSVKTNLTHKLGQHLGVELNTVKEQMTEEFLSTEKLGISRWVLENSESLKHESNNFAKNVLHSVYHRYSPSFVWPKSSFSVECSKADIIDRYFREDSNLVRLLLQGAESQIELQEEANQPAVIKISGGAGTDKEAIRLTIEEMIHKNWFSEDRVRPVLLKHKRAIDKQVLSLGEEAIRILKIPSVHPEIAKLIGSLNFRTSHRQNQYFHSLEVARLAGMIADEVGVDASLAKRSGILHDIGKVLDYKIEGSHAVISADYAKKFDEKDDLIDTVLAHHDDKVVETPWAYILKAADAMSGARPGARVDMDDGYQKRIDSISDVVKSFNSSGVTGSAIMHAGREIHVFVDSRKVKPQSLEPLASDICRKLEQDVQFPGQIKVTLVRRLEVSEVA
jgi:ribonucrease Y